MPTRFRFHGFVDAIDRSQLWIGHPTLGWIQTTQSSMWAHTSTSCTFMLRRGPPHPPHHVQLPSQTTSIPKGLGNMEPAARLNLVGRTYLIFNPLAQVFNFGFLLTTVHWGSMHAVHQWQRAAHVCSVGALRRFSSSCTEEVKFNTL